MNHPFVTNSIRRMVLFAMLILATAACAQDRPKPTPYPGKNQNALPFLVGFDAAGQPLLFTLDGKPYPENHVRVVRRKDFFPHKATQLVNLFNFNGVEAVGSHYFTSCMGDYCVCVDLPHEDGSVGNTCSLGPVPPAPQ